MPNIIANLAVIVWPLISIAFFVRMQTLQATLWTIIGGYLLLPMNVAFDFPLIPPLDKQSVAILSALFGCIFIAKQKIELIPRSKLEKWLIIVIIVIPFFTLLNNTESINGIRGLTAKDAVSDVIAQYIGLIPFILGLNLVKTYQQQIIILRWLVIAGLLYSLLALIEVRLSPQLHTWIYGNAGAGSWSQQFRFGGFRPTIFLGHGLLVAMFFSMTLGAAVLLWKEKVSLLDGLSFRFSLAAVIYLSVILILCRTVGAMIFGCVFIGIIGMLSWRMMKRSAQFFIFIVVMYPFLSILGIFPHQGLVDLAGNINEQRAQSLDYRFFHEGRLLNFAQEKFLLGWGSWGRNRLPGSVTDGFWIIVLGRNGIIGFGVVFGLALLSITRSISASRLLHLDQGKRLLIGHALIVSIIMVDQIVNASMSSWVWFFVGSLMGRANTVLAEAKFHKLRPVVSDIAHTTLVSGRAGTA